jgi:WD40 repeat protein
MLALGFEDGRIAVYANPSAEEALLDDRLQGNVLDIEFSEDGQYLLVSGNGQSRVFELGDEPRLIDVFSDVSGISCALIRDGVIDEWIAVMGSFRRVTFRGIRSAARLLTLPSDVYVSAVAQGPDTLLVVDRESTLRVFDLAE